MTRRYYVYELIDPRDGLTFYVGKGSGNRMRRHLQDVEKGRTPSKNKRLGGTIRAVINAGMSPQYRVIHCDSEDNAFAIERRLIALVGVERLCNVLPGGNSPPTQSGRCRSNETRRKLAALPQAFFKGQAAWNKGQRGYRHTPEARANMSAGQKGHQNTLGWRASPSHRKCWGRKYPAFQHIETGEVVPEGNNLTFFCEGKGLDRANMGRVADGIRRTCQGWRLAS